MEVLETRQKLECMLFLTLSVVNKSENPKKLRNGARIHVCHFSFTLLHVYSARLMILACLGFRDNNLAELRQQLAVFFAFFP